MDERDQHDGTAATNGASRRSGSMSPVLRGTEARVIERPQPVALPAPVVAAAGGAVFGALTVLLVRLFRHPARGQTTTVRIGGGKRRARRGGFEVAASRSFLVDVHMLKR